MTWPPGSPASTANLDSGTDSPGVARSDILQLTQSFNDLRAAIPRVIQKSANYTVTVADVGAIIVVDCTAGQVTITLPDCAVAGDAFPLMIRKKDGTKNPVKVAAAVSNFINGAAFFSLTRKRESVAMNSDGSSDWYANSSGNVWDASRMGVDCTGTVDSAAALQAAINEVSDNGGGVLEIPSHSTILLAATVSLKWGVSLRGGQGHYGGLAFPRLYWSGADGVNMFETDYHGTNVAQQFVERLVFVGGSGYTGNKAAILFRFKDRADWGFVFNQVQFASSKSHAIQFDRGATNFYMSQFRMDSIGGYGFYSALTSWPIKGSIEEFTYDTGSSDSWSQGLIGFDATAASNNVQTFFKISKARLEVNSVIGTNASLINLGIKTTASQKMQHRFALRDLYIPVASTVASHKLVHCTYDTGGPTDQISVTGMDVDHATTKCTLISNCATAGPDSTKRADLFVFDPYNASPSSEKGLVSFVSDVYQKAKPTIETFISLPVNNVAPDVSAGSLFTIDNTSVGANVYIGNFLNGGEGQKIEVHFTGTYTVLSGGTNFVLQHGQASWNDIIPGDVIVMRKRGTQWIEINRCAKKYPNWIGLVDGGASDPGPPSGVAALYVSSVDGDHKIKFSGGPTVVVVAD